MESQYAKITEENGLIVKETMIEDLVEALLYNSMDFPWILKPENIEFSHKKIRIFMKKGLTLSKNSKLLEPQISNLIQALIYLEDNNITYGDLKSENMLILDNRLQIIDFNMITRRGLTQNQLTQSLGDSVHLKYRYQTEEDVKYDPYKDMIWALGINILNAFYNLNLIKVAKYRELVFYLEDISEETLLQMQVPSKWSKFVEATLRRPELRHSKLRTLVSELNLLNIPEKYPKLNSTPTPPRRKLCQRFDLCAQWIWETCKQQDLMPQTTIFSIELFWRYLYLHILDLADDQPLTELIFEQSKSRIEVFCCALVAISGDLFCEYVDLPKMAWDSGTRYRISDIQKEIYLFLQRLEFRLPSLFLDLEFPADLQRSEFCYMLSTPQTLTQITDLAANLNLTPPVVLPAEIQNLVGRRVLERLREIKILQ